MTIFFQIYVLSWLTWLLLELRIIYRERYNPQLERDKKTKRYILLAIFLAIFIGNVFANEDFGRIAGSSKTHLIVGTLVIWVGLAFRVWAMRTLGKFFTTTVMVQEGQRVVKNGPYRYLRHPSYSGSLLAFLGVAIGMGNWIGLAIMETIIFLAMRKRMIVEEKALQESLGAEYGEYMKNTKRIIPFIY